MFSYPEELSSEYGDRGGSISNHIVLDLANVNKDLGGGVVNSDGAEDGGTVVGNLESWGQYRKECRLPLHTLTRR